MFAQMMTLQQQSPQTQAPTVLQKQNSNEQNTVSQQSPRTKTKQLAINSIDDNKEAGHTQQPREEITKRRDNKNTPVKQLPSSNQMQTGSEEWSTPQYIQQIATQQEWTDSLNYHLARSSGTNTSNDDEINIAGRSTSEDEDCVTQGSGNESINKSLEYQMEAEATSHNNE